MTVFSCERCKKTFQRQLHLIQHLARKTPCKESDHKNDCPECNKSFGHRSSLSRHRKVCTGPQVTVESLQTQLTELRAHVQHMNTAHVTNNIDNSVNTTNIDNSINITLKNYGSESQDHLEALSYADLKRVLKLTPDHESLIRMIAFIHLNNQVPENRTVKLDDKDSSVINVFKKGRWRERNADTVLYDLICRNRLRFVDLEEVLTKNMSKGKFEELTRYLCKAEDMANSENADLHLEFSFQDLMSSIRDKIAV